MQEPARNRSVNNEALIPGFAPSDPTDGRERLEWRSKYSEPGAKCGIWFEAAYLAVLLLGIPIAIVISWLEYPKDWFGLCDQKYKPIMKYSIAWLSGSLGGTLFDVKWLYHSVARQFWHLDRQLWRFFTPHISGGLAFVTIALISSPIFRLFDRQAVESLASIVSVAFLVGYFSDNALAKLREIAENIFGTNRAKEEHKGGPKADSNCLRTKEKDHKARDATAVNPSPSSIEVNDIEDRNTGPN
ncbi:MAG: hypothetical protein M0P74_18010 [Syntrophales bacterium]|jgi:hypothetical protein|nr:hypothetical protein [Syntrophales bacterium]